MTDEPLQTTDDTPPPILVDHTGQPISDPQPASSTRWEFSSLECENHRDFVEQLNILGADGWELVSTVEPHGFLVGIMKRGWIDGSMQVISRIKGGVLEQAGGLNDPATSAL